MTRTFQQIRKSIADQISFRRPGIAVRTTDPHSDLFINPVSNEIDLLYREIDQIYQDSSPNTAIGEKLDRLGGNWDLERSAPTSSNGILSVGTRVLPTRDYLIPAGTIFNGLGSAGSVLFYSLVDVVLPNQSNFASNPQASTFAFFNDNNELIYAVDVPVKSVQTGKNTNLDRGAIRSTSSSLSGIFTHIYNYSPTTGGNDTQTDLEFAALISLAPTGNIVGSDTYYLFHSLLQPEVIDASVSGFNDPYMTRDQGNGGKVDVVVIGENFVQVEETFQSVDTLEPLVLRFNPVVLLSSVSGQALGQLASSAYSLVVEPETNPFYNSNRSRALIQWETNTPPNDTVVVRYIYNKTLNDIANRLRTRGSNLGIDLLIKGADIIFVDVEVTIRTRLTTGFEQLRGAVRNSLIEYLNSFVLTQVLDQSGIINVIRNVSTDITLVNTPLDKLTVAGGVGVQTITPTGSQYIRASSIVVNIQ